MATTSSSPSPPPKRILVCGGGVIGTCTAYFLSQNSSPPTKITLIEKSSVACAASGKAGGFLALDWCDGSPVSALARASFNLHRSLSHQLDGPQNYGYRPLHTLSLSLNNKSSQPPSHLPSWIDGPTSGAPRTIGTTETTAQVHPQLFTTTLIDVAKREYGVEVVIGEVEKVEVEGGKVTGATVKEGEGGPRFVEADAVVLALGPWSAQSAVLSSLFNVSGLKAHSIVLRPTKPDAITPHALFLSYQDSPGAKVLDPEVYPRPTGEVYICGMSRDAEVPSSPEEIVGDPSSIEMLHKIAGRVSSHLKKDEGAEVVAVLEEGGTKAADVRPHKARTSAQQEQQQSDVRPARRTSGSAQDRTSSSLAADAAKQADVRACRPDVRGSGLGPVRAFSGCRL